jgi:hypothetical protein
MHTLYFVKIKEAKDALDARRQAVSELENNNFASDNSGYFSSSKADWYCVGGRWGGELTKLTLDEKTIAKAKKALVPFVEKELKKDKDLLNYLYINEHKMNGDKECMALMDEAYAKITGVPYFRDSYNQLGYEDDAMKLTPALIKALKSKKEGMAQCEIFCTGNGDCEEITCSDLTKDDIGSWLVVIDYHS